LVTSRTPKPSETELWEACHVRAQAADTSV